MRMIPLLWYLRLVRSRSQGKVLAEQGLIRSNGSRVVKAHHAVRCGDILTVPQDTRVCWCCRSTDCPGGAAPLAEALGLLQRTRRAAGQDKARLCGG